MLRASKAVALPTDSLYTSRASSRRFTSAAREDVSFSACAMFSTGVVPGTSPTRVTFCVFCSCAMVELPANSHQVRPPTAITPAVAAAAMVVTMLRVFLSVFPSMIPPPRRVLLQPPLLVRIVPLAHGKGPGVFTPGPWKIL